jgi:hypothetical protein
VNVALRGRGIRLSHGFTYPSNHPRRCCTDPQSINQEKKLMKAKFCSLVVFASLCIPDIVSNAQAQCSNATLHGEYMFYTQGTVAPAGTPRVNLAVLTFDGKGNYTSRFVTNDNGTVTHGTLVGLGYQVNTDCTGVSLDAQGVEAGAFIVLLGGEEFSFIRTNPSSLVILGFGKRIRGSD